MKDVRGWKSTTLWRAGQGEVTTLIHEPIISESMVKTKSCHKLPLQLEGPCDVPTQSPIPATTGALLAEKGFPFNAMEKAEQQLYFSPVATKCLQK